MREADENCSAGQMLYGKCSGTVYSIKAGLPGAL